MYLQLGLVTYPCSQAQDELSLLGGTEQLWDHLCCQTDEVRQLVILHHFELLRYLPHEGRHESHWRDKETQGGWRKNTVCRRHWKQRFWSESTT